MIYVDKIFQMESKNHQAKFVGTRTGHRWCHMWCDIGEEENLHRIAERIGLRREWFQDREGFPHYDLVPSKRKLAISNGAIEYSIRDWIRRGRNTTSLKNEEDNFLN